MCTGAKATKQRGSLTRGIAPSNASFPAAMLCSSIRVAVQLPCTLIYALTTKEVDEIAATVNSMPVRLGLGLGPSVRVRSALSQPHNELVLHCLHACHPSLTPLVCN